MEILEKEPNDIKINQKTNIGDVVSYSVKLLEEKGVRELRYKAIGVAINKLVSIAEIVKLYYPSLYQINKIDSIPNKEKDSHNPILEITLSLDKKDQKSEGFQDKLNEIERKKLLQMEKERANLMLKKIENKKREKSKGKEEASLNSNEREKGKERKRGRIRRTRERLKESRLIRRTILRGRETRLRERGRMEEIKRVRGMRRIRGRIIKRFGGRGRGIGRGRGRGRGRRSESESESESQREK